MFSRFSVKKPFTILVAVIIILVLGVVSYTNMTVDLIPSFNLPYAVISTTYAGASPEEVEQKLTSPLEQGMASINNIEEVSSVSSENVSMVILKFNEETNMDTAMIEMLSLIHIVPYTAWCWLCPKTGRHRATDNRSAYNPGPPAR